MRVTLTETSWLEHEPGFLAPTEASAAFASLVGEVAWEQREIVLFGRRILQPRLIAWAGEVGYRYSGQTLEPRPPTPTVSALLVRVCEVTRLAFNHVLINRYRDENDSMGFHSDDEPELGPEPQLASLSLGAERRLAIRAKRKCQRLAVDGVTLGHGDLLVMGGAFQRELRHGVPKLRAPTGERINLTFRWLRSPPS